MAKSGSQDDRRALALAVQLSQGGTHPVNTAVVEAGRALKGLLPQISMAELRSVAGGLPCISVQ